MQYAYGPIHVIVTSLFLGLVTMAMICQHGDVKYANGSELLGVSELKTTD